MDKLEDQLLKYISEQNVVHPKDVFEYFEKKYRVDEVKIAITEIECEGLIVPARGKRESFCLTLEGKKALKVGFAKYVEMKERENELDYKVKISTLWSNYINIINILWGLGGFIIGILTKNRLIVLWEWLSKIF